MLALLRKYGLRALLDVHAMSGSQNGFDNSGEARKVKWTQVRQLAERSSVALHRPAGLPGG